MLNSVGRAKVHFIAAAALIAAPLLSACQSDSPKVPPAQLQPVAHVVGPQPVATTPVTVRRTDDGFPTFDGKLTAAGQQMSDEEASQMDASLSRLSAARSRGSISQAEYNRRVQELRDIGAGQKP